MFLVGGGTVRNQHRSGQVVQTFRSFKIKEKFKMFSVAIAT